MQPMSHYGRMYYIIAHDFSTLPYKYLVFAFGLLNLSYDKASFSKL